MNQYTTTPKDSRTYDANGNLLTAVTSAGTRSYTYDYRNMMVGFEDEGGIVSEYRYDALGRRIEKVVDTEGTAVTTRYLHNSRWQVIEERDGSTPSAVQATYIHGAWIDETIQMMRGTTASYYLQDDLFSTVGVVDHTGTLVETVEYADYGEPLIRNATGLPVSQSTVSNARLFTGREWDTESRLYSYRTRYMDSEAGRFDTRDSIGTWGDPASWGNGLAYVGNSPSNFFDPLGMTRIYYDFMTGLTWPAANTLPSEVRQFLAKLSGIQAEQLDTLDRAFNPAMYHYQHGNPGSLSPSGYFGECVNLAIQLAADIDGELTVLTVIQKRKKLAKANTIYKRSRKENTHYFADHWAVVLEPAWMVWFEWECGTSEADWWKSMHVKFADGDFRKRAALKGAWRVLDPTFGKRYTVPTWLSHAGAHWASDKRYFGFFYWEIGRKDEGR